MKINIIIFLFIASALFTLNSCKKDYLVNVNGTVEGTVRDDANKPLNGVTVTLDGTTSKTAPVTVTTDTLGYYKITGIAAGNHILLFSKTGYSVIRNTFTIQSPDQVAYTTSGKKQSFSYYATVNPSLYTLGGQLKGYVYYNGVALANAKVTAFLNGDYEPNTYTTTTNDVGAYSFSNLPVLSGVYIVATHPTEPGTEGEVDYYGMASSSVVLVDRIDVNSEPFSFVKGDYFLFENGSLVNNAVDTTASINLTFSDNVSQVITQNKGGYVEIDDYYADAKIGCAVTYSANKITIKPNNYLIPGTWYAVYYKVYSTENKYTEYYDYDYMTYYFKTKARPAAALSGTPSISIATNALHLVTPTANAQGYDIYYSNGKTEFLRIATNSTLAADYSIAAYPAGSKFYIVPETSDSNGVYTYGTQSNTVTK